MAKEEGMSTTETGLDVIEKTVQKTYEWLKEIEEELETDNRHFAFQSLRAVLHVLRDRLPLQEASNLANQLPLLVRGVYFETWNPSLLPIKDRKLEEFLARIPIYFPKEDILDPERLVRGVFNVLKKHVSKGEIDDIRANFPTALKKLWD